MNLYNQLINYLFPTYCLNCEKIGPYLCDTCNPQLQGHPQICIGCHTASRHGNMCLECYSSRPLQGVIVGFTYNALIKNLITQSKYNRRYDILNFLSDKLTLHVQSHPQLAKLISSGEIVVSYVPMHRYKKIFLRGFNQSELLAVNVGQQLDLQVHKLVSKTQHTRAQMKKSRNKRLNLRQSLFKYSSEIVPQNILLIDDITTTGTSLKRVAQTIKEKNPQARIRGCVVARHH